MEGGWGGIGQLLLFSIFRLCNNYPAYRHLLSTQGNRRSLHATSFPESLIHRPQRAALGWGGERPWERGWSARRLCRNSICFHLVRYIFFELFGSLIVPEFFLYQMCIFSRKHITKPIMILLVCANFSAALVSQFIPIWFQDDSRKVYYAE